MSFLCLVFINVCFIIVVWVEIWWEVLVIVVVVCDCCFVFGFCMDLVL